MRKTKLTLISLLAVIGIIGAAWSAFLIGWDEQTTHNTETFKINVDSFAERGTITDVSASDVLIASTTGPATLTLNISYTPGTKIGTAPTIAGTAAWTFDFAVPETISSFISINETPKTSDAPSAANAYLSDQNITATFNVVFSELSVADLQTIYSSGAGIVIGVTVTLTFSGVA